MCIRDRNIPITSTKANEATRQIRKNELKYGKNTTQPPEKELVWQAELIAKHPDSSGSSHTETRSETNYMNCPVSSMCFIFIHSNRQFLYILFVILC